MSKIVTTVEPYLNQFDTGDQPLMFLCIDNNLDLKNYVVKYANMHNGSCLKLLTEYIGASLAKLWGLNTPDFTIVDVRINHIRQLPRIAFERKCFGSEFQSNAFFLDSAILKHIRKKHINKFEKTGLLLIGLFDIWTANEDRNWDNANLLYSIDQNGLYSFISIDYGACFNSCNFDFEILSDTDVIYEHNLYKKLFVDSEELLRLASNLKAQSFELVKNCESNWNLILNSIPKEWKEPYRNKIEKLEEILFTETWLNKVLNQFDYVIKHSLRRGN